MDQIQVEGLAAGSDIILLDPGGEKSRARADREPRKQRNNVASPGQASLSPEQREKKGARERGGHRFAQKGEQENGQRQRIPTPVALAVESQVGESGEEIKHQRERVLLLRNPSDRLYADRMQRENSGRQPFDSRSPARPGSFRPDAPQYQREQAGRGCVQPDVHQVVAKDRVTPKPVLKPEGAVEHRIVLLSGADLEPDLPQTVPRLECRSGDVGVVVPKQSASNARKIGEQNNAEERHDHHGGQQARRTRLSRPRAKRGEGASQSRRVHYGKAASMESLPANPQDAS